MTETSRKDVAKTAPGLIVVLGGYGFLGSHICRALVEDGHPVRIFDKSDADRKRVSDIVGRIEIVEGDVARPGDVLEALQEAQTVVHLVHTTVPGSSMADPSHDVESNVAASVRWLSQLGQTSVRRIIFVSSGGTVYGVPRSNPINEHHPTDPISSYGITKLALEKYVAMYALLAGIDYLILRPSNVYGEGQQLHNGQGVIGVLADRAVRGEPLEVWGTGESLRDYLYIADFVDAVRRLLSYAGPQRVFNVSSGEGRSVSEIVQILSRQLDGLPEVRHVPSRNFDVPANVLDSSRLKSELGWEPRFSLDEGIARVIRSLLAERMDSPAQAK